MKKKLEYISYLSVISCLSVITLHTNGIFWSFSKSRLWITSNIIECVFYFAVPIFFMITGITLMDYRDRYDTKTYFKKRIQKTLIPFIAWSIIGLLYRIYINKSIDSSELSLINIINGILNTKYITIYWFFISLFQVYLFIPILSAIDKKKRNEIFKYILIVSLIITSIIPLVNNLFKLNITNPITFTLVSPYILYVVLGYLLHNSKITKKQEYTIYIYGLIGLMVHIIGTYYLSFQANEIANTFKGYTNLPCVLYSTAIFVFIKNHMSIIKNNVTDFVVKSINDYTFGIYLMHWYIINISTTFLHLDNRSIIFRLGMPLIITPICVLIIKILRKIPIIKKIVP